MGVIEALRYKKSIIATLDLSATRLLTASLLSAAQPCIPIDLNSILFKIMSIIQNRCTEIQKAGYNDISSGIMYSYSQRPPLPPPPLPHLSDVDGSGF